MYIETYSYYTICPLVFNEERNEYVRDEKREPEGIFPGDFVVPRVSWMLSPVAVARRSSLRLGIVVGVLIYSNDVVRMRLFDILWCD